MNDTRAVIGMPQINAIPTAAADSANTVYVVALGVVMTLITVWKFAGWVSKDKVGMHEDRAREDIIKTLQDSLAVERAEKEKALEEAREAWNTRTADAMKIAELTVTIKFLSETNTQLVNDVNKLRSDVHSLRNELAKRPVQS